MLGPESTPHRMSVLKHRCTGMMRGQLCTLRKTVEWSGVCVCSVSVCLCFQGLFSICKNSLLTDF